MFHRIIIISLFLGFIFASCKKSDSTGEPNLKIDVSIQWKLNQQGGIDFSPVDGQWVNKSFIAKEMELFKSLDTTNLRGTRLANLTDSPIPFPNPFSSTQSFSFLFSDNFSGDIVLKYIIVNEDLFPLVKNAVRITSNSGRSDLLINPSIPIGKYRIYFTLSSESNPHFYKTWGNIEKM
jgi:hypothetical protein